MSPANMVLVGMSICNTACSAALWLSSADSNFWLSALMRFIVPMVGVAISMHRMSGSSMMTVLVWCMMYGLVIDIYVVTLF